MPVVLNWPPAGPAEDDFRKLVAAVQEGRLVALPTDAGYVTVVSAAGADAEGRLLAAVDPSEATLVRYVTGAAELPDPLPGRWERVLSRLWPGPIGVSLPSRSLRYRVPRHPVAGAILSTLGNALIACETDKPAATAAELAERLNEKLDVVVDSGQVEPRLPTWLSAEDGWRIERPGSLSEAEIREAAAVWVAFVCTGNTCRSPMAEAIFRRRLADRVGCPPTELPARGYRVFSAGVSAYPGDAASPDAIDAVRGLGGELDEHRSRPLTMDMVAQADHLIAMTRSHLLAVLSRYPQIGGSMRLLCGADGDLDDPIGGTAEVYGACAKTIDRHVTRFLEELVR